MKMETQRGFPTGDSISAFSALHLLRNYNQIFLPSVSGSDLVQVYQNYPSVTAGELLQDVSLPSTFSYSPLAVANHPYPQYSLPTSSELKSTQGFLTSSNIYGKRPRGEKKPIPEDQKDDRYYERRKRNNQAAKKSRDARKLREDQIALRATLLEHENAILRAQLLTLREETGTLRQLILSQKKPLTKKETKERVLDCDPKWKHELEFSTPKDLHKITQL